MFAQSFDIIRYQTRFAAHVASRDVGKRLAAAAMMVSILLWIGYTQLGVLIGAGIIAYEVLMREMVRILPERDEDMSKLYVFAVWLINSSSMIFYLAPAFPLASEPSAALLLGGFLWLFGVFVHITNTFAALSFYNWSLMVPAFGSAFGVFWVAARNQFLPSSHLEWTITAGMMVVYIFNTFETLHKQKDTQRALNAAREEAYARLRALEQLSRHDPLTGLLNRRAFDDELERLIGKCVPKRDLAVYLIDLDKFKPINDTYGHEAGDRVLQAVARRLKRLALGKSIVARLGGDEFVVAFVSNGATTSKLKFAERLARVVARPIVWNGKELQITASIGVAVPNDADATVAELCSNADQAMFRAKTTTGPNVVLYHTTTFEQRPSLEDRYNMVSAMRSGQIRPFYQPKVDLETGASIGFEALARWVHPEKGIQYPGSFLPQINDFGLQGDFLTHMTSCVLHDVTSLLAEGLDPGQISINVPEVALATQSGHSDLEQLLNRYPDARKRITLEITEDVFIARAADTIRSNIARFREAGVRISLDDFGTGFASFQHMRELDFDELKIDTSFVADLGKDPTTEVLIRGFLDIASGLGVTVIAEGIETEEQVRHLRKMGCSLGQGFLFGKAMPIDETRMRLFAETSRSTETLEVLPPLAAPAE